MISIVNSVHSFIIMPETDFWQVFAAVLKSTPNTILTFYSFDLVSTYTVLFNVRLSIELLYVITSKQHINVTENSSKNPRLVWKLDLTCTSLLRATCRVY